MTLFVGIIVRVVPFASDFLKLSLGLNRLGPDISSGHLLIINYLFDVYSLGNHFHPLNVHATPVPNRQSHRDIVYRLPTISCLRTLRTRSTRHSSTECPKKREF